ncbi:hypothetical protein SAY86_016671 [Trapa natans]|uniref:Uncharacterized protein n=1 Tax=Trapa natans TaxID=22666 RepID=A0AAN7QWI7_TRANT|nr:hypothetical protein SAY86_016671 [Trapa natans]
MLMMVFSDSSFALLMAHYVSFFNCILEPLHHPFPSVPTLKEIAFLIVMVRASGKQFLFPFPLHFWRHQKKCAFREYEYLQVLEMCRSPVCLFACLRNSVLLFWMCLLV